MGVLALGTFGGWLTRDRSWSSLSCSARRGYSPATDAAEPAAACRPSKLLPSAIAVSPHPTRSPPSSGRQSAACVSPTASRWFMSSAPRSFHRRRSSALINAERGAVSREPVTFSTFFAGIGFIRSEVILGSLTLDLSAVVLGGANAMLPIYAMIFRHRARGPGTAAFLRHGALAVSFLLPGWPIRRHAGPIMFTTVAIFGLATIAPADCRRP